MIYSKDTKFIQYKPIIIDVMSTILGWTNIKQPSTYQDRNQCTDLVSSQGKAGVRIRKASYSYRDFTIRNRQYDTKSEIDKIYNSPLTHYLLMYQDNYGNIVQVYIIDVQAMRQHNLFQHMKSNYQSNHDSTGFYYLSLAKLKALNCIVWQFIQPKSHIAYKGAKKQQLGTPTKFATNSNRRV